MYDLTNYDLWKDQPMIWVNIWKWRPLVQNLQRSVKKSTSRRKLIKICLHNKLMTICKKNLFKTVTPKVYYHLSRRNYFSHCFHLQVWAKGWFTRTDNNVYVINRLYLTTTCNPLFEQLNNCCFFFYLFCRSEHWPR